MTHNSDTVRALAALEDRISVLSGAAYTFHYRIHSPDKEVLFVECTHPNCLSWLAAIDPPEQSDGDPHGQ